MYHNYRRKLALISQLFKTQWLSKNEEYGFSQSLDAAGIAKLFNSMASRYCEEILGMTSEECKQDLKGCGLNSNCAFDETCVNDANESAGYRCVKGIYFFGLISWFGSLNLA